MLLLAVQAQAKDPIQVVGVSPREAHPGGEITLSGQGLGQTPEDLFAWVDTGTSGFSIEITHAAETAAEGRVGAVAAPASGDFHLWKGSTYPLPDRTLLTQGRLVSATGTRLFVASEEAQGLPFSALSATVGTLGSARTAGALRLDLDPPEPTPCPQQRVRVSAVIETGGDPGGGGGGGNLENPFPPFLDSYPAPAAGFASPAWVVTLEIVLDAPWAQSDQLAAALAEILEAQFRDLGLSATAQGSELVLSHSLGIRSGFMTLSF
jgi:hypothetical protein